MNTLCFHCGLEVPPDVRLPIHFQGKEETACCVGCQAVAQGIIDAGLEKYYTQRTEKAEKAELPPQEILEQLKLYDLPEIQAEFVSATAENSREALLMLSGVTCAACVWLIEQRLIRLKGMVRVDLNYSTLRARVVWDDTQLKLSQILLEIKNTGYDAAPYDAARQEEAAQKERKSAIFRLWVAGLSMMQVMMYAVPTWIFGDIEPEFLRLLHWASMMLTLPVVLYSAMPFYRGALRDLKNRRVGMDTPVALAVVLAFSGSLAALILESGRVFFDCISMFVFLLLGGRYLEQMARRKAADATERLVKLVPAFCHRLPEYPHGRTVEETVVARVQTGDVLLVKPGEIVPADGTVLEGASEIDEALLTGESLPVAKTSGSAVIAGTHNLASPLAVRVTGTGAQTRLGSIVRLLDTALAQKPRMAQIADRYASWFVGALLVLTVAVFAYWAWAENAEAALWIAVSLLVITCPCALSLATPTALAAATSNLTSAGLLVAHGRALETLAEADTVIFDKTGTLTEGQLSVCESRYSGSLDEAARQKIRNAVYTLESHSEHPIARALTASFGGSAEVLPCSGIANHPGRGIQATFDGQILRIGNLPYVAEIAGNLPDWADAGGQGTQIFAGGENGFQAAFTLRDTLKEDAAATVSALRQMGLETRLLSGDSAAAANAVGAELGIAHITAEASPEDKLAEVVRLQQAGRRVLMVGDGVNDAPVLAQADVSVAMAGGADVSRAGSDMVMMNRSLGILPRAVGVARKTRRIIRENLGWALVYNLIAIPVAAAGYARPEIAALGMSASSLLVVCNALRLLR